MLKILILLCVTIVYASFEVQEEYEEINLPNNITPLSYDLKITPNLSKSKFYGKVGIDLSLKFSTNDVKLHCRNLKINDFKLYEKESETPISIRLNQTKNLCTFTSLQQLNPDLTYVVSIGFEGDLNETTKGLYRTSYETRDQQKWLIATNFQDNYAREVFPCFDEPRFKVPFVISVARKLDQKVLSSTLCDVIRSHNDKNLVWNSCKKTPSLPTHKLAFVVTEYSFTPETSNLIKIWTRPDLIKNVRYALKQSDKVLKQLENFIGIPYKISKLDIVVAPGDKPRISKENWELFLFAEADLISDENSTSQLQNKIITTSLCHQLARHWFGGQVTLLSWDYTWLTEAFAGYLAFSETVLMEPTWKINEIFNIDVLQPTLWEELNNSQALTSSKKAKFQANDKYQLIYQNKGTSIIRMLEHVISKSSLRSVIYKYLTKSEKSNQTLVTPDNLFDALRYQSDIDSFPLPAHFSIVDVMKTWAENQGYPLLKIIRNYQSGAVEIEQYTYTYTSNRASTTPYQKWIIPINYATKSEASFSKTAPSEWVYSNKTTLSINVETNDWIIFNLQQTGYYRVNYDQNNWNLLITQLKENMTKIHHLNRAQLIDDAFTFAFEDELPYNVTLNLATYLENEVEIVPMLSAVFHLNKLYTKYEDTSSHKLFKMYIQKILEKPIIQLLKSDNNHIKMKKSSILLLACKVGLSDCIQSALQEYNSNIRDLSKVQPDLKEVVFCTALREIQDSDTVYENLMTTYRASNIAYEKITILKTLGCTGNENILKRLLSNLFDKKDEYVAKLDEDYVYDSIISSSIGITITLRFIQERFPQIEKMKNDELETLKKMVHKIIPQVQTTEHTKILKILNAEFDKLGQNYSVFTELLHRACSSAKERVKENNKNSAVLKDIFYDVLNIPSVVHPPTVSTKSLSNAAIASFPLLLLGLCTSYITFIIFRN